MRPGRRNRRSLGDRPSDRSFEYASIDPERKGQDRVIAIVKELGGTRYVNPSGGRDLYDGETFARAGLELRFLTPYGGGMESILSRLLAEPSKALTAEILRETQLVP